jgi:hypothetical protein
MAAKPDDIDNNNKYLIVPPNIVTRITNMKNIMEEKAQDVKEAQEKAQEEKEAQEKEQEDFQNNNRNVSGTPDNMCIDKNDLDNRCVRPPTGPTALGGP